MYKWTKCPTPSPGLLNAFFMNVTIFKNIKEASTGFVKSVQYVLDRIKSGKSADLIEAVRGAGTDEERKAAKEQLPSICFSGSFKNRSIAGLRTHSGLICLDFDKFPDADTLQAARETLMADLYTFALFTSPSGNGLKVLVKIPPDKQHHKAHFDALAKYYNNEYFDSKTSDVSRVCFESYDPELFQNLDSLLWVDREEVELVELGSATPVVALESENRIIKNILKWWNAKYGKNKGSRNSNFFILAAALNDFGVSKTEAMNTMQDEHEVDFTRDEIGRIVESAYKKTGSHGTRFFEDYVTRNNIAKEIINGKTLAQIQKNYPEIKNIETVAESVKETLTVDEFWAISEKGKYYLVHHKFKQYIEQQNIFKYFPTSEGGHIFISIHENKVEMITPSRIKDIVLEDLYSRPEIGFMPYELMSGATKFFKEDYLSIIKTVDVSLKKDTSTTCHLYYEDNVVRVTQNGIELIPYEDIDGFVWKNHIINRPFARKAGESEYSKFLFLIAGKDEERYNSLRSVIGYYLHSYKSSANNQAVILNDEVISDNPNGGSGKGLFWNAIKKIKKVSHIDGKQFKHDKSFPYQTVTPDTQILVFDDVRRDFSFEFLFSLITEGIVLEKKNKDAIPIPVEDSPKILITTNYTIGGVGGSHERRKFEVEFSSHFGAHHSPLDEFGHMMFDDWKAAEWLLFDNFMIECLQYYLANGLVEGETLNLETRKCIKETNWEFYEWAAEGNLPVGLYFDRNEKYEEFLSEYPDHNSPKFKLSQKRFKQWVDAWAKLKGMEHETSKSGALRRSILIDPEGRAQVEAPSDVQQASGSEPAKLNGMALTGHVLPEPLF